MESWTLVRVLIGVVCLMRHKKFERPDFPQLFSGATFLLALARSHDPRHIDLAAAGMVRFLTVVGARMEWIRASTLSKFSGSIYPGTFRKKMIRSNLAEVTQHKYCWEESRETGQTGVSLSARARPQCIYDPVAEVEMTPLAGVVCT
uniref:Uncharacterized protein n=1 Tax=Oryza punctata TaxID=4537 RepID=A0A0E0L124_ORYPU